jgi:hypothetical protein
VDLNLPGNLIDGSSTYISLPKHCTIVLQDREDEFKWLRNKAHGNLTMKLGFEAQMDVILNVDLRNHKAWW